MLEYAGGLLADPSLWPVAAAYLATCGPLGAAHLAASVERIPLDTDRKAHKVLHLCHAHGLADQGAGAAAPPPPRPVPCWPHPLRARTLGGPAATTVCRVMGRRALGHGRVGAALQWYLRCEDVPALVQLADALLSDFAATGVLDPANAVGGCTPAMLCCERLLFVGASAPPLALLCCVAASLRCWVAGSLSGRCCAAGFSESRLLTPPRPFSLLYITTHPTPMPAKYKEFLALRAGGAFPAAGALLVKTLQSALAPRWFWPVLLRDALPLLEHPVMVFDAPQVRLAVPAPCSLASCLQLSWPKPREDGGLWPPWPRRSPLTPRVLLLSVSTDARAALRAAGGDGVAARRALPPATRRRARRAGAPPPGLGAQPRPRPRAPPVARPYCTRVRVFLTTF